MSVLPAMLLVGVGMATILAALTTAALVAVAEHRAGAASGAKNVTARVSGRVAISLLRLVLTADGCGVTIHAFHATPLAARGIGSRADLPAGFRRPGRGYDGAIRRRR